MPIYAWIAAALIIGASAHAQGLTQSEIARNRKLEAICNGASDMRTCMNEGIGVSNRLRRANDPRPFQDHPASETPNSAAPNPPLPAMPSCRMALAACDGPCPWEKQVRELIAKSDPCEFVELPAARPECPAGTITADCVISPKPGTHECPPGYRWVDSMQACNDD